MPNWCNNTLTIIGPKTTRDKLVDLVTDGTDPLCAEKIIPYPEKFKKLDRIKEKVKSEMFLKPQAQLEYISNLKDGFNSGGYEWCNKNWGTKWGFCRPEIKQHDAEQTEYYFESAWSPPEPLIAKLARMYESLEFILETEYEGGEDQTTVRWKNGSRE